MTYLLMGDSISIQLVYEFFTVKNFGFNPFGFGYMIHTEEVIEEDVHEYFGISEMG